MTYIGATLLSITTIFILLLLILNRRMCKITRNYYFYLTFSILFLAYFLAARYSYNINDILDNDMDLMRKDIPYSYSFFYSKLLLLDMCPFVCIALPISLIIDKTRNTAKVISLFGLLGGSITIYGNMIFTKTISVSLVEFIFLGESPNYMMFMSHFLALWLSICVLLNSVNFTKWSVIGAFIYTFLFVSYVLIASSILGIECNTTGLRIGDWINPYPEKFWFSQYKFLYDLIPMKYEFCVVTWYTMAAAIIFFLIYIKNELTSDIRWLPRLWSAKFKKLNKIVEPIDNFINRILRKNDDFVN